MPHFTLRTGKFAGHQLEQIYKTNPEYIMKYIWAKATPKDIHLYDALKELINMTDLNHLALTKRKNYFSQHKVLTQTHKAIHDLEYLSKIPEEVLPPEIYTEYEMLSMDLTRQGIPDCLAFENFIFYVEAELEILERHEDIWGVICRSPKFMTYAEAKSISQNGAEGL